MLGEYDYTVKILIVGDSGVGKTSLMNRIVEDKYESIYRTTIGVDFNTVCTQVSNKFIKLLIWDTAGQERFKSITQQYYRGAQAVIFVYDLTDSNSFKNITQWLKSVEKTSPYNIIKILVGNKLDSESKRQVSIEDAFNMVEQYKFDKFFETSAKNSTGVDETFLFISSIIVSNGEQYNKTIGDQEKNINLENNKSFYNPAKLLTGIKNNYFSCLS